LSLTLEKPFEIFEIIKKETPEIMPTFEPQTQSGRTAHFDSLRLQNPSMLESWDSYRKVDWINEIEYPEFTSQETQKFLSAKFLSN